MSAIVKETKSNVNNTVNKKMKRMDVISEMMKDTVNIRNISVIAHVDHGKTTLTDSLLAKCGLIGNDKIGNASTDTMKEERERGITIKSTSVSLCFNGDGGDDSNRCLINLIDCPGHIDFNSEVTASLRITDGALVIVDCIEGVCVQTETVLRQAMEEKIESVLFLNKMDRIFLELNSNNEEIYQTFKKTIDSVNSVIQTYKGGFSISDMVDTKSSEDNTNAIDLLPSNGKVGFGSGLHGWGFTLKTFTMLYTAQYGIKYDKLMEKFWGDNYFDRETRKWKHFKQSEMPPKGHERGFVEFVLKPLRTLVDAIMNEREDIYSAILQHLGVESIMQQSTMCKDELSKVKKPKDLLKIVLKTWIPAADALVDMISHHLPNPIKAQSYRIDHLYSGALDSKEATMLRQCRHERESSSSSSSSSDVDNYIPMCFYVSKMVPTNDFSRFIAFGRVFSGSIKTGQEISILGDEGSKQQRRKIKIQKCYVMMGGKYEIVNQVPCGNVCGILGLDNYMNKSGSLVDSKAMDEFGYVFLPFKKMTFSVSPIVEIAISTERQSDLCKLTDGLRKLNKFDNLVKIKRSPTGQMIIAGAGELHLETCLNTLENLILNKQHCPIKLSEPIVNYNETIIGGNNPQYVNVCVSKSTNKHNRLYCSAESLLSESDGGFVGDLENNSMDYVNLIKNKDGIKQFQNSIMTKYPNYFLSQKEDNKCNDLLKIWSFGCVPGESSFTNVLCDCSKGIQLLKDIKSDMISSFEQSTMNGVLCHEEMRGIKFNILDAKIHGDKMHRNAASVFPMTRRVLNACQINFHARLMEPMYKVEIMVNQRQLNGVYNTLHQRRGIVNNIENNEMGTPLVKIDAILPVSESFGFTNLLRANTQGTAFPTLQFSHWSVIPCDPFSTSTNSNNNNNTNVAKNIILNIRKRKGMKQELPQFNDYYDKIN